MGRAADLTLPPRIVSLRRDCHGNIQCLTAADLDKYVADACLLNFSIKYRTINKYSRNQNPLLQLAYSSTPNLAATLTVIPESTEERDETNETPASVEVFLKN
ncbi:unnamed protein product [Lupinus luteus]|uniref:Uncharacterized protein n=1 Tax=Lupinus luteus TaxID=3873 RepID=A0AAV1YAI0_LUPLU